jgi:hypothetical protein
MVKILWDQCEAEVATPDYQQMAMNQGIYRPTSQCSVDGEERTMADGFKVKLCGVHWSKCTGVQSEDGVKHMAK